MGSNKRNLDGSDQSLVTPRGNLIPLGFEGESWDDRLATGKDGNQIPVPGTGTSVVVIKDYLQQGKFSIITTEKITHVDNDDVLMLACLVQETIDGLQQTFHRPSAKKETDTPDEGEAEA